MPDRVHQNGTVPAETIIKKKLIFLVIKYIYVSVLNINAVGHMIGISITTDLKAY